MNGKSSNVLVRDFICLLKCRNFNTCVKDRASNCFSVLFYSFFILLTFIIIAITFIIIIIIIIIIMLVVIV